MASTLQILSRPSSRCLFRLATVSHPARCRFIAITANHSSLHPSGESSTPSKEKPLANSPPVVIPVAADTNSNTSSSSNPNRLLETVQAGSVPPPPTASRPRPRLKASKAAMSLTPTAISHLRALLSGPNPQYIRVGVRNKGCAGMAYHLEYVDKPGKFDEKVEQDGVTVLIDSKALFSIIGSEMDWVEDKLSSKFAFKNPNIKDACGCGESFNVQPSDAASL